MKRFRDSRQRRRVVITGLGVISSMGHGHQQFWEGMIQGRNCAKKITSFDTAQFRTSIACEIDNFTFDDYCDESTKGRYENMGKASQYAIAASSLAIKDSKLKRIPEVYDITRAGVVIGTTMGEVQILHDIARTLVCSDLPESDMYKYYPPHNLPASISKYYGLKGPCSIVPTACASGNYAIGFGCDLIRDDKTDIMIVGGVDPIDSIVFAGFSRLFSIAPELCQPFDKNRKGILVGEGAAVLILESLEGALQRNARIYGEIIGYGLSCDAYHMTNPDPDVRGTYKAALSAFDDADMRIEKVDCIVAHGTGTPANDAAETKLIKKVFGTDAYKTPITANKSMIGHTMGGAAAMNAVVACRIISDGIVPPSINYSTPDPVCDLDYVPNEPRKAKVTTIMSNAFAFGGNNSVMLFKRPEV